MSKSVNFLALKGVLYLAVAIICTFAITFITAQMKKIVLLFALALTSLRGYCQADLNFQMIAVKGGSFFMGCDDAKYLAKEYDDERPYHRVSLTPYYIGKYEVTNGQWRKLMGIYPPAYNGVNYANKDCDDCPVVMVNWDDAQEFINKLNVKFPGKHYRLPTETEWEYAARGGRYASGNTYPGSNRLKDVAWYGKPDGATHPIGKKDPNELGIYDLAGNVSEWLADWYGEDYYKNTIDEISPKGPKAGEKRVVRGGSYYDDDVTCRSVYRDKLDPETRKWNLGFRLAMDVPGEDSTK